MNQYFNKISLNNNFKITLLLMFRHISFISSLYFAYFFLFKIKKIFFLFVLRSLQVINIVYLLTAYHSMLNIIVYKI